MITVTAKGYEGADGVVHDQSLQIVAGCSHFTDMALYVRHNPVLSMIAPSLYSHEDILNAINLRDSRWEA